MNRAAILTFHWPGKEKGVAPASVTASRVVDGKTERTRPLCPHPQVARYSGTGSVDDAASFRCESKP